MHPSAKTSLRGSFFRRMPAPATMAAAPGEARRNPVAKLRVLSTHLFLHQHLHPGLLELAAQSGAQAVELFAARQHFDYTSREHVAELAAFLDRKSTRLNSSHLG